MKDEILRLEDITVVYPNGFKALENVTFSVKKGEIHALLGENGAGKTTLMNVLFGFISQDEGSIYLNGEEVHIKNALEAIDLGIGMVHQHFKLVPSLTVAENIVLGMEPEGKMKTFNFKEAIRITKETSEKYNMPIDPYAKIIDLSVGNKQKVEILKILVRGAKIMILDEPTAVLTPQETEGLFKQMNYLRDNGFTIIFISHKLNEIMEICDRYSVLRNGKLIGMSNVEGSSPAEISRMMVGRDIKLDIEKDISIPTETLLSVRDLTYVNAEGKKIIDDVSFSVKGGEILGVAAVEGNGQNEMAEIIAGIREIQDGVVTLCDENIKGKSIRQIRELGVAHISEDRLTYGCAVDCSVKDNIISDRYFKEQFSKGIFLKEKNIKKHAEELIKNYAIKCFDAEEMVSMLSGGNMQKVIVSREFTGMSRVIVANQPTRGIDIGSAQFIRNELVDLSRNEKSAIILVSADLTELLGVSDKLVVMHEGKIVAYFPDSSKVTDFEVGEYMLGLKTQYLEEMRLI